MDFLFQRLCEWSEWKNLGMLYNTFISHSAVTYTYNGGRATVQLKNTVFKWLI